MPTFTHARVKVMAETFNSRGRSLQGDCAFVGIEPAMTSANRVPLFRAYNTKQRDR